MEYHNPKLPEGINTSKTHPLRDFLLLLIGVSLLLIVAVLVLSWSLRLLGPLIPFSWEQSLSNKFASQFESGEFPQRQAWLQQLADKLVEHEDLPQGMSITMHYSDSETINALATLGGHVVVFQGLIDSIDSENALAMVIAHEIAHVKHRHPIVALGRALGTSLVLSVLDAGGDNVATNLLSKFGLLAVMSFNREQERESDTTGLTAVNAYYGHVNGAADFFSKMQSLQGSKSSYASEFFATHPDTQKRIAGMRMLAELNGWVQNGNTTSLRTF